MLVHAVQVRRKIQKIDGLQIMVAVKSGKQHCCRMSFCPPGLGRWFTTSRVPPFNSILKSSFTLRTISSRLFLTPVTICTDDCSIMESSCFLAAPRIQGIGQKKLMRKNITNTAMILREMCSLKQPVPGPFTFSHNPFIYIPITGSCRTWDRFYPALCPAQRKSLKNFIYLFP